MDAATTANPTAKPVIPRLQQIVGSDHVLLDEKDREFYSTDLSWRPREIADIVVQPSSIEQLSSAISAASEAGMAIVPRGGGMSYTSGYTPSRKGSLLIDMRRMSKVQEINTDDMYVIVEAGCTWKDLHEVLAPHGVSTPYWGPLSGA